MLKSKCDHQLSIKIAFSSNPKYMMQNRTLKDKLNTYRTK